jgi:two-component system, OmpR family, KDP operon response regulator KdpE
MEGESTYKPLVLVIEDDPQIRQFLKAVLSIHEFRYLEATTAREGLMHAASHNPDVIVLDLGLPDQDGLEVTAHLRSWSSIPIIILSARGQESDKVTALDLGADDYVSKPFGAGELLARIRVAIRHKQQSSVSAESSVIVVQKLRIDLARREIFFDDQQIYLTPLEYKLLITLAKYAGKVLTHQQLLKAVWGPAYANQVQYLRVYMGQLRRKIERDPAQPVYIQTEQGVGYRLAVNS